MIQSQHISNGIQLYLVHTIKQNKNRIVQTITRIELRNRIVK